MSQKLARKALTITAAVVIVSTGACGKSSKDKTDTAEESGGVVSGGGGGGQSTLSSDIGSLNDLKLTDSLKVTMPKASASGAGLALQSGLKSREACELRRTAGTTASVLNEMRRTLCHVEAESEVIEFGKKYTASWGIGETAGSYGVFVDNATPGSLTVYVCSDGSLNQKYVVTGGNGTTLRGSMKAVGQWTAPNGKIEQTRIGGWFDNGVSNPERRRAGMVTRKLFQDDSDHLFSSYFNIKDDGVSMLKSAVTISTGWSAVSTSKIDSTGGMVSLGTSGGTYRAFHDSDGNHIEPGANEAVSESGRLHVSASDLTALLPLEIEPAEFDDTDWDCSAGEEWVFNEGNARSAAHALCDSISTTDALPAENCGDSALFSFRGSLDASAPVIDTQEDPVSTMAAAVAGDDLLD